MKGRAGSRQKDKGAHPRQSYWGLPETSFPEQPLAWALVPSLRAAGALPAPLPVGLSPFPVQP